MRGRAAPPHPGIYRVPPPPEKTAILGTEESGHCREVETLRINVWTDKCPLWAREVAIVAKKQSVEVRL